MKVGVLAMQGAYREHIKILHNLNIECIEIRNSNDLEGIDGLIIPGGESTTMGKLLKTLYINEKIENRIKNGMPVWGTCAGMILLANSIQNQEETYLSVMNIEVKRNAYGRQLGSFYTKASIKEIGEDIDMVFIRAPYINKVGSEVKVLSIVDDNIVAARQNNMLVTSFHPELTSDYRVHKYFIDMIK